MSAPSRTNGNEASARARLAAPLAVFVVVVAAYAPSVGFGFLYDDHEIILLQAAPRSVTDVARMFAEPHGLPLSKLPHYRAPTRATLLGQKAIHGDRPAPFHALNALLAGVAALGAWAVLRHRRFRLPLLAAALGAAAFALHPAASSCVYPISSGRETLLPVACALFAVAAHLRGGLVGRGTATALLALAVLGKEQGLLVPVLFVLADALALTPDAPGRSVARWCARLAPSLAVVAGYLALRGAVMPPVEDVDVLPLLLEHWRTHWWGPLSTFAYAAQTWLVPGARVVYEPELASWWSPWRLAVAGVGLAGLGAAARRLPREDLAPVVFWLAWIPVGLGLNMRLLPQEAAYAERFLLLSSLGLVAIVATVGARAAERRPASGPFLAAAALIAVTLLLGLSLSRGRDYRDEVAFAARWAATSPSHPNARFSYGTVLARHGRTTEAMTELREATRLAPGFAPAHYNLGVLLAQQGRHAEATAELGRAAAAGDSAAREALQALERAVRSGPSMPWSGPSAP